jgi:AhpD family alkylhydroperoxidase
MSTRRVTGIGAVSSTWQRRIDTPVGVMTTEDHMDTRIDMPKAAPEAYRAVLAFNKVVAAQVDHGLFELIKIRASMTNNCAFCIDMHTTDALAAGEDLRRIVALAAWRESRFFSDEERAVLALTDQVTELGEHGVTDEVWNAAAKYFDDEGMAHVVMAIAVINVWNRVALSTQLAAPPLATDA